MGIPSNPLSPGTALTGKISYFGGPTDTSAGSQTASGASTSVPGIAVYNQATLGGYWLVTAPNGRQSVVKQTDLGPAPWTGRVIDFTYSSLGQFGYGSGNFPTDATAKAVYLGRSIPANYQHLAQQGPPAQQQQGKSVNLPPVNFTVPTFDQAGYNQALHGYRLGQAIKMTSANSPYDTKQDAQIGKAMSFGGPSPIGLLYQKGVLRSTPPNVQDYQGQKQITQQYQTATATLGNLASAGAGGAKPGSGSIPAQLFPQGTKISLNRHDAGRDMQVTPNSPVLALGNGTVVATPSDPGGFGNSYTVAHFTSGPWAGMTVYFGHAQALLRPGQSFTAGQAISKIQNGSGPYVGNSAGMPGWIEIGLWGPSGPLNNGQLPSGL